MAHTTKYGNKYTAQEWLEMQDYFVNEANDNDRWLEAQEKLVERAAGFLHQEFADVSLSIWINALNNPNTAQFTDSKKETRFDAAQKWIEKELAKV